MCPMNEDPTNKSRDIAYNNGTEIVVIQAEHSELLQDGAPQLCLSVYKSWINPHWLVRYIYH